MKKLILLFIVATSFAACEVCEECTTKVSYDYPGSMQDEESTSVTEICGKDEIRNAEKGSTATSTVNGVTVTVRTTTNCLAK